MFFKMLKNDLKMKKGLNIILFIFISVASVLTFVSAAQLYMHMTGTKRTNNKCNTSNVIMMFDEGSGRRDYDNSTIEHLLPTYDGITGHCRDEGITLSASQIDFERIKESEQQSFFERKQILTTLPHEGNLVYDINDEPFYVKNGTVAISCKMRDITGSSVGDTIKIYTPMGRVYEFEISCIYKETMAASISRYILSDDDYKVIAEDSPIKTDIYSVYTRDTNIDRIDTLRSDLRTKYDIRASTVTFLDHNVNDDYIITYILTAFVILVSIFMLIIILMTIRFTMISALRDEEKEIGMMRAMGIDSVSFRWLFAAKYIGFAVAGGIIGIIAGLPLSKKTMQMFAGSIIYPQTHELILVGTVSALMMTGAIILFCMLVMRRIKKISVIDAICGENRGERFEKSSSILLHKCRHMPVSVFLGLSDILTRVKRYIFLIIAYTLGAVMILCSWYLYHTVINVDYWKYSMIYQADFYPDFNDEMKKEYKNRAAAEGLNFWEILNEDMEENNIAAHIDICSASSGELLSGGRRDCEVAYDFDTSVVTYSEGKAPLLKNEVALSSYTAKKRGINIGDEIDVALYEYTTEDKLNISLIEQKVIVTGYIDYVEWDTPLIIMGSEYDRGIKNGKRVYALKITGEDKQAVFDQLYELFDGHILDSDGYLYRMMSDYELPLRLLRTVISGTVIFVTILITMLYMNIFISEDKAETALLKCVGFRENSVRSVQLIRMLSLVLLSILLGIVLTNTAGEKLANMAFGFLGLNGFRFLKMPLLTWGGMPFAMLVSVTVTALIKLRSVRNIDIGSITEE